MKRLIFIVLTVITLFACAVSMTSCEPDPDASFRSEAYTENAKLMIDPAPDTLIRVFMAYKPLDKAVEVEAQEITTPARNGFTVVEWGGSEVK